MIPPHQPEEEHFFIIPLTPNYGVDYAMQFGTVIPFIAKVQGSNRIVIPSEIIRLLSIKKGDYIEAKIRKIEEGEIAGKKKA